MVRIGKDDTEKIRVFIYDDSGNALTGLTDVLLKLYRKSDGYFYTGSMWQDNTATIVMAEEDSTNKPGWYYYDFDTSGLNDDVYYFEVTSVSAIVGFLAVGELRVGYYIDEIKFIYDEATGKREIVNNQEIFYKADNTTEIARFNLFDKNGVPTETNVYKRERV